MSKYLIVNSDDFGISAEVSRGIIEAHHNGILTSTTCMINMPAAEAAIEAAQQSSPRLGIGLHFVLSYGKPVSPPESVPSLVTDDGGFVTNFQDLMAKMPTYTADDLEREMRAQFERFCAVAGRLPTHLDGHHHAVYHHPASLDMLLRLAHEHNLPIRRIEALPAPNSPTEQLAAVLEQRGMPRHTDYFTDYIFDFASTPRTERLKNGLLSLQDGYTEAMVHVGYGKDLDEPYNFQRDEELEAVTDAGVKQIIAEQGIQLINFDDLP